MPTKRCLIKSCKKKDETKPIFHLPALDVVGHVVFNVWMNAIDKSRKISADLGICARHFAGNLIKVSMISQRNIFKKTLPSFFLENAIVPTAENKDKYGHQYKTPHLKTDAIPSLFLDPTPEQLVGITSSSDPELSMETQDADEVQLQEDVGIASLDNDIELPYSPDEGYQSISMNRSVSMISLDHDYANIGAPPIAASTMIVESEKFKEMMEQIKALQKANTDLIKENDRLKKKVSMFSKFEEKFGKLFDADQIDMVLGQKKRPRTWSDKALQEGIEIRFSCGTTGYRFLRKRGFPFPCETSLQERLQLLELTPGVLVPNFKLLSIMLDNMGDDPGIREASLSYDAMKGNEGLTYNMQTQQIDGYATLPPTFDPNFTKQHYASHQMVFILARIKRRWKVPVAMYFTHKDSFTAESVKKELETIVTKANVIASVNIRGFANDMGSCNQGLWRLLGINLVRDPSNPMNIKCYFEMNGKRIYVFADREHVIKNNRCALYNQWKNGFKFKISEGSFQKYLVSHQLVSRDVDWGHIIQLYKFDESREYKLAPKLNDR